MVYDVLRTCAIGGLLLAAAAAIVVLLHGLRPRWRSGAILALAGVVSASLLVAAKFEPVHRAVLPFRYEAGEVLWGTQRWDPHDAPVWLVALAERGQLERPLSSEARFELFSSKPEGTVFRSHPINSPSGLSGEAHFDPNAACGVPGTTDRDPGTTPGALWFGGFRAWLFYAFGSTDQNAVMRGAILLLGYGLASAVLLGCVRRVHPSHRVRASIAAPEARSLVLCRAAWWSLAWPATATLAHTFFFEFYSAHSLDLVMQGAARRLPLALGARGIVGIWSGAGLACALTLYAVATRAAHRADAAALPADAACCDVCGYPLETPLSRCPECGTEPGAGAPKRGGVARRGVVWGSLWFAVVFLLCAPLTFPLVGRLLPESLLPVESIGTPVQNP